MTTQTIRAKIYRKDYRVSNYLIKTTDLVFEILKDKTIVKNTMSFYKNPKSIDNSAKLFLNGCQNTYKITYNSKPQGAAVICNDKSYGYTPIQLEYALQDYKQEKLDYLKTRPCIAQWISGAKADYADIIDIKKYPNGVIQTLQRPLVSLSILNYDKDIEFENKIQKERE